MGRLSFQFFGILGAVFHVVYSSESVQVGDGCDPKAVTTVPLVKEGSIVSDKYLLCHAKSKSYILVHCPSSKGDSMAFVADLKRCMRVHRSKRQITFGSGRINDPCNQAIDCVDQTRMYCLSGRCTCLSDYFASGSTCVSRQDPGTTCSSAEQCTSVWPDTTCSGGVCTCGTSYSPVQTRDGTICVYYSGTSTFCPLPGATYTSTTVNSGLVALVDSGATAGVTCTTSSGTCTASNGQVVSDLYDCIPTQSSTSTTGICCPNRAYTCTLPSISASSGTGTGPGTTTIRNRYFYNSVTGACQPMTYTTTATIGNSNNFVTLDQCVSYCQRSCPRGTFQYTGTTSTSTKISCSSGSCSSNYECTRIGSSSYCCTKQTNICSTTGGISTTPSTTQYLGIQRPGTATSTTRWRWDSTANTCVQFAWLGQAGDFNNFASQSDCTTYCGSVLCTQGQPIADSAGRNLACSSNTGCPASYTCTSSVCCPRPQTVCAQPQRSGSCTGSVNRYWYNAYTRLCEQFFYTGCGGNANNFENELTCQSYCQNTQPEPKCIQGEAYRDTSTGIYRTNCDTTNVAINSCPINYECYFDGQLYGCCPTQVYTCSLSSSDIGQVCGPQVTRYYYDRTNRYCTTFTYNGCGGNPNNFVSLEQCNTYCGIGGCPYGGAPFQDTGRYRLCNAGTTTCPSGYDCLRVAWQGSTANYCCLTRQSICTSQVSQFTTQSGCTTSTDTIQRFYFDPQSKNCRTYLYTGCNSNGNDFATLAQCTQFCDSSACNLGETAYVNPNTRAIQSCNIGVSTGQCPTGYTCKLDTVVNRYVCCGSTDSGVCPVGSNVFMDARLNNPRPCSPGVNSQGGCPGDYSCELNQRRVNTVGVSGDYYCCASSTGNRCPTGRVLYQQSTFNNFNNANTAGTTCLLGTLNTCPNGYSCQNAVSSSPLSGGNGYCCSISAICPNNGAVQTSVISANQANQGQPVRCTVGLSITGCATAYNCVASTIANEVNIGYCCSTTGGVGLTSTCSNGGSPYQLNGVPQQCNAQFGLTQCNRGYTCQLANRQSNVFYCCSPPTAQICQVGTTAQIDTAGSPVTCTQGSTAQCQPGYTCTLYAANQQFYCCGNGNVQNVGGCPTGQQAQLINNQPITCTLGTGVSTCQSGYSCQYSFTTRRFQCCGSRGNCPLNSVAQVQTSGLEQRCSAVGQQSNCGIGYVCASSTAGSICCSGTPTVLPQQQTTAQCPQGMQPATGSTGVPLPCNGCPFGTQCTTVSNQQMCCSTNPAQTCTQNLDVGTNCVGRQGATRYSFNTASRQCNSFFYRGCGGNSNNFFNQQACTSFCAQAAPATTQAPQQDCPIQGQRALLFSSGTPVTCDSAASNCPGGYSCQRSPRLGFSVCCGTGVIPATTPPPVLVCPNTLSQPYRSPIDNQVQRCTQGFNFGTVSSCPPGYTCSQARGATTAFVCCQDISSPNAQTCPTGSNVFLNQFSRQPSVCTPFGGSAAQACTNGYLCTYSSALRNWYCCSTPGNTGGGTPSTTSCSRTNAFIYPSTNSPLACPGVGSPQCPSGFTCQFSSAEGYNMCCRPSTGRKRREANFTS